MEMFDTIIVGGGPAGLSAGIYASRRGLNTLILTKDIGGQIAKSSEIENYPGVNKCTGAELAGKFFTQAQSFGAKIKFEDVKKITKKDEGFLVNTNSGEYGATTLIITAGKAPKKLDIPGEDKYEGRGVSYCATCDAPFFRDKTVVIVGGGNSAMDAALLCSKFCKEVIIVYRSGEFRGENILIEKVQTESKIKTIFNAELTEIKGNDKVESVLLNNGQELATDGVIVEVGFMIDRTLIEDIVELDDNHQVITDNLQKTNVAGIFAAGDITQTPYKQVIIAAGEGAKAALSAYDYIQKLKGKRGIMADWH